MCMYCMLWLKVLLFDMKIYWMYKNVFKKSVCIVNIVRKLIFEYCDEVICEN